MSILPIVTYNDSVLRDKTEPISELTEEISELIEDMIETMYNSDGVGLAAPQIGKSLKLFVMDGDPVVEDEEEKHGVMVFINPEIVEKKGKIFPWMKDVLAYLKFVKKCSDLKLL